MFAGRISAREWRFYAATGGLASWACTVVFIHLVQGGVINEIPAWHEALLSNNGWAPLQYRWSSFLVPEIMTRVGLGIIDSYLVLRFLYLAVAFTFCAGVGRRLGLSHQTSVLFLLMVALYYASSTQAHLQPAEEPILMIFAIAIFLLLSDARLLAVALVVACGVTTKSSIVFFIPLAFGTWHFCFKIPIFRAGVRAALLSLIFVLGYVGVRLYFGTDRPYVGGYWQVLHNFAVMRSYTERTLLWLLPSLAPGVLMLRRWRVLPMFYRCALPMVLVFSIGHFLISRVDEWRTYTPLALVTWPYFLGHWFGDAHNPDRQIACGS